MVDFKLEAPCVNISPDLGSNAKESYNDFASLRLRVGGCTPFLF